MTRLLLILALGAIPTLSCARESPPNGRDDAAKKSGPPKAKPAPTDPAATRFASHGMPGPLTPEPGFEHGKQNVPKPTATTVKSTGEIGEQLEGDVYFFKLLDLKPCGEQPDPKTAPPTARRVVAAEVEIIAKGEFNANPRDVVIGVGGISFNGSVEQKRKLPGCSPLLPISVLRADEVAKGFVLFDIPVSGPGSDLGEMSLAYKPTRFGGAGQVTVRLPRSER